PIQVIFEKSDFLINICKINEKIKIFDKEKKGQSAIAKSQIGAVIASFPIAAYSPDSSAIVFEATSFFINDDKSLDPLDPKAYNSLEGYVKRTGTFKRNRSQIASVEAYPDNASVTSCLSYSVSLSLFGIFKMVEDKPLTALVKRTFLKLPDEGFISREADARVGTAYSQYIEFSGDQQGSRNRYYANRWRLEPKDKDAFLSGKLSEPQKPIVFYVDNTFPEKWQEYISRSVAQWNKVFEILGYEEIISANIYICHNLPMQIQRDRLLQTAAYDKSARTLTLNEEDFGKAFVSMLMRNIGHCLGLTDNLAGSAAYSTDSLRSAGFTKEKGLSSSVMDDLTFNYLLSADHYKKGDSWCQESIGEYDYWAIRWLYGSFSNADTPEKESAMLKKLVSEKSGNPVYMYGKRQNRRAFYDPRSMSRDLGNNAVESVGFAFKNLSEVIAGMNNWIDKQDYDYSFRKVIYGYIINQVYDYMIHVFQNVGGIYINEKYAGDPNPTYQSVPKEIQKNSLLWIMQQIEDLTWLDNSDLIKNCGLESNISNFAQNYFGNFIFVQLNAMALSESKSDDPYTQLEAARDVMNFLMKESNAGKIPSDNKISLQSMFVDNLIRWSNLTGKVSETSSSFSSILSLALKDTNKKNVLQYYDYIRKYPELINSTTENEGMSAMQSVRFNVLPERSHEWYGMLLNFKSSLRNAANKAPTEELKNTYLYQIYKIDKALSKD
ncbi:zinc-dependent metalloprotease, partial [Coprobacter fastidiosus]|uniref:zinc-dependent metalloprotease n=1 Tax=Coprobacter fastidiosus TaxID=1099853 RepID=UPI0003B1A9F4